MPNDLIEYPSLGPRTFVMLLLRWSAGVILSAVVLFIAVTGLYYYLGENYPAMWQRALGMGAVIFTGIVLLTIMIAWLEYRHYSINLTETSLEVRRGVLSVIVNGVAYRRIRDLVTTRSLIERIMGVSTLCINLIGDAEEATPAYKPTLILPSLDRRTADRLHSELAARIGSLGGVS
ncbi:MAG: PH domain-containing protein [Candidatus Vogelbacteria bacterium]|nr:PH domain-containing protein [Candidatus Vogelbacteria bacterium]